MGENLVGIVRVLKSLLDNQNKAQKELIDNQNNAQEELMNVIGNMQTVHSKKELYDRYSA